jgi:hypothetical protein
LELQKIIHNNKNKIINIIIRRSKNLNEKTQENLPNLKNSKIINLKIKIPEK